MKKVLFASAAALCAVVGLSSFNADKKAALRYFNIPVGISLPSSTATLFDDDVEYRGDTNPGDVCAPGNSKLCVVSIETTYLTAGKQHIIGSGAPVKTVISTRN